MRARLRLLRRRPWLLAALALLAGWPAEASAQSDADAGADPLRLIDAVKAGDSPTVRALLDQGVDVTAAAPDGSTALLWASYRDDLETAQLLLAADAAVDAANDLGVTPVWAASENRSVAMVELLLGADADPNLALLSGETAVMVAARSGSADVVARLARAGAVLNLSATRGQTALMWAAAQRHADVVATLVEHGADVHQRSDVWSQVMAVPPHSRTKRDIPHGGNTPLMFAARAGDLASARHLVAAGANVDAADAWGMSATAIAAHGGHTELVELLLEDGADPNAAAAGVAPLHNAVMRNDARMVVALLEHDADPDIRLATWTPTRRASADHHFPAAFVGATPFWLAARFAQTGIMRLLADHGADPLFVHEVEYIADGIYELRTERTTASMAALAMGGSPRFRPWVPYANEGTTESRSLAAVTLATDLGVDVNATDATGRTALDEAEARHYASVVTFLLERGAGNP